MFGDFLATFPRLFRDVPDAPGRSGLIYQYRIHRTRILYSDRIAGVVLDGEKKSLDGVMSLDSGFRTELKGGEGVIDLHAKSAESLPQNRKGDQREAFDSVS